jgi:hypothetical protein
LIYVDGEADRSFATDGFTPSAAGPTFARASWFDGYYLGCALDEAMLFPAALPAREIRREFERFRIASLLRAAGVGPALRGVRKAVIFQMKPLPREPQRGFARGAAQRSVKANPGESNFDGDL